MKPLLTALLTGWGMFAAVASGSAHTAGADDKVSMGFVARIEPRFLTLVGKLSYSLRPADPIWADGCLPRWQIATGREVIPVEFADPELAKRARKMEGNSVVLVGSVETRKYYFGMRSNGKDPVPQIECEVVLQVFVVRTMELSLTRTVELKGKLLWQGNHTTLDCKRMPITTTMYFDWEGYVLEIDGRTYRLEFADEQNAALKDLVGRTVTIQGLLGWRLDGLDVEHGPKGYQFVWVTKTAAV